MKAEMNGQHYIGILPGVPLHRYEKHVHIVLLQHPVSNLKYCRLQFLLTHPKGNLSETHHNHHIVAGQKSQMDFRVPRCL